MPGSEVAMINHTELIVSQQSVDQWTSKIAEVSVIVTGLEVQREAMTGHWIDNLLKTLSTKNWEFEINKAGILQILVIMITFSNHHLIMF